MLPLILVAVGAYLIGDSVLEDKKYAKGGKTQGYDDKEDERLAMEHGKMSKKDLDSTHARRDDARFEERGKMAKGGELNVNDIINKFGNYINTDEAQKKWDNSTIEERLIACGYNSDYQNVKFKDLPIYVKNDVSQYYFLDKYGEKTTNESMFKAKGGMMAKGGKLVGKQKNLDVNKNGKLDAEDFKMLRGEKMANGGFLRVTIENQDETLHEIAKYMVRAIKKRADFKDLVVYFEKDNDYDYKYRVKIFDEMNVYEMKKTEENIYKVLKAIVEANEAKK